MQVQEAERRAIARELHDEIGQVLTGLKLTLEISPRLATGKRSPELQNGLATVQDLIKQVEGISTCARPCSTTSASCRRCIGTAGGILRSPESRFSWSTLA